MRGGDPRFDARSFVQPDFMAYTGLQSLTAVHKQLVESGLTLIAAPHNAGVAVFTFFQTDIMGPNQYVDASVMGEAAGAVGVCDAGIHVPYETTDNHRHPYQLVGDRYTGVNGRQVWHNGKGTMQKTLERPELTDEQIDQVEAVPAKSAPVRQDIASNYGIDLKSHGGFAESLGSAT